MSNCLFLFHMGIIYNMNNDKIKDNEFIFYAFRAVRFRTKSILKTY